MNMHTGVLLDRCVLYGNAWIKVQADTDQYVSVFVPPEDIAEARKINGGGFVCYRYRDDMAIFVNEVERENEIEWIEAGMGGL